MVSKYANLVNSPLVERIEDYIEEHKLKEGDRLPAERDFCAILGVSRMTLRQAVKKLCEEKRLVNVQNRGYFIARPRVLRNFTAGEQRLYDGYRLIGIERICAQGRVAARLHLTPNSEVYKIKRVCMRGEERISIETSYFPAAERKTINIRQLDEQEILEFYRTKDSGAQVHKDIHISLGTAGFEESEWLEMEEGGVVAVERHVICQDGAPLGMTEYVSNVNRISYGALLSAEARVGGEPAEENTGNGAGEDGGGKEAPGMRSQR